MCMPTNTYIMLRISIVITIAAIVHRYLMIVIVRVTLNQSVAKNESTTSGGNNIAGSSNNNSDSSSNQKN